MRLLKIGVYYPDYLAQFYAERPGLAAQSYAEQHAALIDDCFGSSDFWTSALSALGYETCDLIVNAGPMQSAWAAEHGFDLRPPGGADLFAGGDWLFPVAAAQIEAFRPDVLLVADYTTVTAAFIRHLRERCPTIRLVLGWCGAPYRDGSVFGACDLVLSCVPELVSHFRDNGHRSRHVNHAFEPRVLEKLGQGGAPRADFLFIGSVIKSDKFHLEREAILLKLVEETGLEIFSNVGAAVGGRQGAAPPSAREDGRSFPRLRSLPLVGAVARGAARALRGAGEAGQAPAPAAPAVDERIVRRSRPPLFGLKMFRQLRAGRVALNTHIDVSPVSASNMRLFEATGVGTCLLTDWKANLPEMFEPDAEVVTYRGAAECVEKVRYLLDHEAERRGIAEAGQRRTLRDHTFADRASRIDVLVREALSNA
ncbi:MAG TPA: glycosyltransferase [Pyrinomonadaceae bacterium]|nr:glycosyltransferase [Pyrinomonadaceae bacterium]